MYPKGALASLFAVLLMAVASACIVEKSPEAPPREPETKVDINVEPQDKGTFERLGQRMDRGAKKLDKQIERSAEDIGRVMQKAGARIEENAREAQQRREAEEAAKPAPDVDIDVQVERP
jgi:hypothetical protein